MGSQATVQCNVYGFRPIFRTKGLQIDEGIDQQIATQQIRFNTGENLKMVVSGLGGPEGISETAADLIDFAVTIYQIEKLLKGRQRTNPPAKFVLSMQLRNPDRWSAGVVKKIQDILLLLGNAEWLLDFQGGLTAPLPVFTRTENKHGVENIVLFSGGMDSTCGLAKLDSDKDCTRLVSFYTRQKSLQRKIAQEILGFSAPVQWSRRWVSELGPGRGHTFYYRSFLFLCLAAATAKSWGATRILQFENGILASSIPPAPSWLMTKHAHPQLHKLTSELFSMLFGGNWEVDNPFRLLTKRGCFQQAIEKVGKNKAEKAVSESETCWFQASNRINKPTNEEIEYKDEIYRGKELWQKKPGTPCGICIPCIIRRTAYQEDIDSYKWDLNEDSIRNDPSLGAAFRSYFLFLSQVADTGNDYSKFYQLLPASGRYLLSTGGYKISELHQLFSFFSDEFMESYDLGGYQL